MNEDTTSRNTGNLDQALATLRQVPIPEPPPAQVFLARLPAPAATVAPAGRPGPTSARRRLLIRRGVQLTTAATLLSAYLGWLILSSPGGNALAQTIEATAKREIAHCKLTTTAELVDDAFVGPAKNEQTLYFDLKSPRFRTDMHHPESINGTVSQSWSTIQDNRLDRVLMTSNIALVVTEDVADEKQRRIIEEVRNSGALGKRARLFRITGKGLYPFTNLKTEKTLLEILREFRDHNKVVTLEDTLDGRSTFKYQLEEQDRTSTLWVDAQTKLPVRIEEVRLHPSPKERDRKWVLSDFEWDVAANKDELFSVEPPAGYTVEDRTNDED